MKIVTVLVHWKWDMLITFDSPSYLCFLKDDFLFNIRYNMVHVPVNPHISKSCTLSFLFVEKNEGICLQRLYSCNI